MHRCSLLNVVLLSLECSANGCRVMRNKAQNATLERRSTPLINGTEITLGAFLLFYDERMEGWRGGKVNSLCFYFASNCSFKALKVANKRAVWCENRRA